MILSAKYKNNYIEYPVFKDKVRVNTPLIGQLVSYHSPSHFHANTETIFETYRGATGGTGGARPLLNFIL